MEQSEQSRLVGETGRWKPRWYRTRSGGLWILCGLVLLIGPCGFSHSDVCRVCGATRSTNRRELLFEVPYFTTWWTSESPLSRTAARLELVAPHSHDWLLFHGSGRPFFSCALGPGTQIEPAVRSSRLIAFLETIHRFEGESEARVWLRRGLDPEESPNVLRFLSVTGFPKEPPVTRNEYDAWRTEAETMRPFLDGFRF